jgi:hypothetical protein
MSTATRRVRLEQSGAQRIDQGLHALAPLGGDGDAEFLADRLQEFGDCHARVEDQGNVDVGRLARKQRTHDRGLAGANLAGELDETAGRAHPVEEMAERLGVATARIQVPRIGSDRERRLGQTKESFVHPDVRLRRGSRGRLSDPGARRRNPAQSPRGRDTLRGHALH